MRVWHCCGGRRRGDFCRFCLCVNNVYFYSFMHNILRHLRVRNISCVVLHLYFALMSAVTLIDFTRVFLTTHLLHRTGRLVTVKKTATAEVLSGLTVAAMFQV
jgi:hypothetical protein